MTLFPTSSSLRTRPLPETLEIARRIAATVGITRVTDTTMLDCFGVPVFASIRPDAVRGGLCVNAGKGMTADEAEAGAYMESIELAFAEPSRSTIARRMMAARDLYAGPEGYHELTPIVRLLPDERVLAVEATDIVDGSTHWVPAERVFFPMLHGEGGGVFGSDGNGVCSGNTLEEATLHGLAEVIERDVTSFVLSIERDTRRIRTTSLPPHLRELAERTVARGAELHLRYAPNMFGLPYFLAGIVDVRQADRAHRGDGLHPSASIAATRAVCEAFQSRLTDIHGGRDDLSFHRARENPTDDTPTAYRRFIELLRAGDEVDFGEVPDLAAEARDIRSATSLLLDRMRLAGLSRVLRVSLAPEDLGVTILRVLVPGAECRTGLIQRMGRRLRAEIERRRGVVT